MLFPPSPLIVVCSEVSCRSCSSRCQLSVIVATKSRTTFYSGYFLMVYFISVIAASTKLHSLFLHLTRAVKHRRLLKTFSRLVLISKNVGNHFPKHQQEALHILVGTLHYLRDYLHSKIVCSRQVNNMFVLFVMPLGESNWSKYSVWHLVYVMQDLPEKVEHIFYDVCELMSIQNSLNPGMFSIDPTTMLGNRKASKTCRHFSSIFCHVRIPVYDSTHNHFNTVQHSSKL